MSTHTRWVEEQLAKELAAKKKPRKKAKRDENGRFVKKDDPDLDTPSM